MATISYLWKNRATFPMRSMLFYRAWAKRIILLPTLFKRNLHRWVLVSRGANIHPTSEMSRLKLEGKSEKLWVGSQSFLGRIHLALHDEVIIGSRVCINDGVELLTASHDVSDPEWKHVKGKIVIHDYAWVGTGALILPGVTIGRGAVVGARAVVSKDVAPNTVVVGSPAVLIEKKRADHLNYNPCAFLAENRAWLLG